MGGLIRRDFLIVVNLEFLVENVVHMEIYSTKGLPEGVISETGIILGEDDMEDLIFKEMQNIRKKKKLVSTKMICHALREAHGLMEDTVDYMVDSGKILREICG